MFKQNKLANKNFLSSLDITTEELIHILEVAKKIKNKELKIKFKDRVLNICASHGLLSWEIGKILDKKESNVNKFINGISV